MTELKMLRFSVGVTRMDRARNEYIRATARVEQFGGKVRGEGFSTLIYSKVAVCSCRAGDIKCLRGERDVESKHVAQTVKSRV